MYQVYVSESIKTSFDKCWVNLFKLRMCVCHCWSLDASQVMLLVTSSLMIFVAPLKLDFLHPLCPGYLTQYVSPPCLVQHLLLGYYKILLKQNKFDASCLKIKFNFSYLLLDCLRMRGLSEVWYLLIILSVQFLCI